MVKAPEPGTCYNFGGRRRPVFRGSTIRRVFMEGIVSPVLVVVVHIVLHQPPQMAFIERDDMIEDLTAATSHPAFRNPVLPGGLNTGVFRLEARCLQEGHHLDVEFRVAVQDHITIRTSLGEGFS